MNKKTNIDNANLVFEELEPRLLLSADGLGVLTESSVATLQTLVHSENENIMIVQHQTEQSSIVIHNKVQTDSRSELVIIDSRAPNFQQLHNDVIKVQQQGHDINVVILDAHRDGLEQISDALNKYNKLDAVHIVSHGKDAQLQLGATQLNNQNLKQRSDEINKWKQFFTEGGDLLIYGCNLAGSANGTDLVNSLSDLTGTDVAASDDVTGNNVLGGDWDLEYQTGDIETSMAFTADIQDNWPGTLNADALAAEQAAVEEQQQEEQVQAEQEAAIIAESEAVLLAEEKEAEAVIQEAEQQAGIVEEQRQEIVFADESVSDFQSFIDDLQANSNASTSFEIVLLESNSNGIEQMNETLSAYNDVDALHIISQGEDGAFKLGDTWLNSDNLDQYSDSLTAWGSSLDPDANILIYGSSLASNEAGQTLVNSLSSLTGADVAASDDLTASSALAISAGSSTGEATLSANVSAAQTTIGHEIIFVDTQVADYQLLVDDLNAHSAAGTTIEMVLLDSTRDGIAQIGETLQNRNDIDAIHIFSHGVDGALELGNAWLNGFALEARAAEITQWANALSADADFMLYGCNVAQDAEGQAFTNRLSELTGADVAASDDATGSAALGGDWNLEYATGLIEASVAIDAQTQQDWVNVMAITVDNTTSSAVDGGSSLSWSHAINSGSNGILIVSVSYQATTGGVTSVTYGGTALTLLGAAEEDGGKVRAEMWYMKAPAAGTANVVITTDASMTFTGGASNFFGVDQTTPTGTFVGASGALHAPSVTVASAAGEVVIDTVADRAGASGTVGASQTEQYREVIGGGGGSIWGSSSNEAGASSVTMDWSLSGSGAGEWAAVAVSLKPVLNEAPVLTVDPTDVLFLTDPIDVDPTLTITDVDSATLDSAQVWLGKGFQKGQDRLLFTDQLGITGSFSNNSGILTLTGTATVADYQTALRSIQYDDSNPNPSEGQLIVNFTVFDGSDNSNVGTRSVIIVSNLLPRAGDDAATLAEGTSTIIDLAANDSYYENSLNLASIVITSGPANGSIVVHANGTVTYTHDGSETIGDTFTYTIKDTDGNESSEAQVTITVTAVNDSPVVGTNTGMTVAEGSTGTVITTAMLNEADPDDDGAELTYTITTASANGTLRQSSVALGVNDTFTQADIDAGLLTYDHDGSETTSDSYAFSVADGGEDGAMAANGTFNITVTAVNDVPAGLPVITGTATEDQTLTADTSGISDADGLGAFSYQWQRNGSDITGATASTYTLGDADVGSTITVVASYTDGGSTSEAVSSAGVGPVANVNDAAVIAGTDTGAVSEDLDPDADNLLEVSGALTITDTDTGEANFTAGVLAGTYGNLTIDAAGNWAYEADNTQAAIQNLTASDTLTDTISVTSLDGTTHDVIITIGGVNDAPVANNNSANVNEGQSVIINLAANDTDMEGAVDLASIVITSAPSNGSVVVNADGTVNYTHNGSETIVDSFTYTILDASGAVSNIATVTLTVNPVNDAPTAQNDIPAAVDEGGAAIFDLAANDFDLDNTLDLNSIVITSAPANGSLITNGDGTVTYLHDGSETSSDTFAYIIADITGAISNTANVNITVNPVNDAPVIVTNTGLVATGIESISISNVQLNVNDIDNSNTELMYTITTLPDNGELTINGVAAVIGNSFSEEDIINNRVSYQSGGTGTNDQFGFTISDGAGGSIAGNSFNIVVQLDAVPADESVEPEVTTQPEEAEKPVTEKVLVTQVVQLDPVVDQGFKPIGGNSTPQHQQPVLTIEPVVEQEVVEHTEEIVESYDADEEPEVSKVDFTTAHSVADIQVKSIEALWMAIDEMNQEMSENVTKNISEIEFRAAAASSSGVVLTAGVVAWVLRSGALMASLISTIPLWKGYDPLPLLVYKDDEEKEKVMEDKISTSPEELKKVKALKEKMQLQMKVDRLFDHSGIGE